MIPHFGKDGAAIATLLAYLAQVSYLYYASQKLFYIPYELKNILIIVLFSWTLIAIDHMFLPTWGWMPITIRLCFCLLFIPLAFWLKVIKPEQFRALVVNSGIFGRKS